MVLTHGSQTRTVPKSSKILKRGVTGLSLQVNTVQAPHGDTRELFPQKGTGELQGSFGFSCQCTLRWAQHFLVFKAYCQKGVN